MGTTGESGPSDAGTAAASALFNTLAELRPAAATQAARRVVLADLLTGHLDLDDRHAALMGCLLADFGRVVLRLPPTEAAQRCAELLAAVPGLRNAADAVHYRHERVDGSGLPAGLSGADIPIGARVIALTDLLVSQRRPGPIDWERRIEVMKDNASSSLDAALATRAFDLLRTREVRTLIENATVGSALAIIEQIRAPGEDSLSQLRTMLDALDDPDRVAQLLVDVTWSTSPHRAIGVHKVQGELLSQVCVAGALADQWSPMALTESLAALSEPVTTTSGDSMVTLVPVRHHQLWGLVWGISDADDADVESLTQLAETLEKTIETDQHRQHLDALAHHDDLTGLPNRRKLEAELQQLFSLAPETRSGAALIMCDIDGLKRVNDTRGHSAGDEVLRAVAAVLNEVIADEDAMAARLGGDEFCILLRSGALLRAQAISRLATDRVRASAPSGAGLSCGIAYAAQSETASDLLSHADEAQYLVKRRRPDAGPSTVAPSERRRRGDR